MGRTVILQWIRTTLFNNPRFRRWHGWMCAWHLYKVGWQCQTHTHSCHRRNLGLYSCGPGDSSPSLLDSESMSHLIETYLSVVLFLFKLIQHNLLWSFCVCAQPIRDQWETTLFCNVAFHWLGAHIIGILDQGSVPLSSLFAIHMRLCFGLAVAKMASHHFPLRMLYRC